jgi:hypothetical protein
MKENKPISQNRNRFLQSESEHEPEHGGIGVYTFRRSGVAGCMHVKLEEWSRGE